MNAWGSRYGWDEWDGWIEGLMHGMHMKNAWDECLG